MAAPRSAYVHIPFCAHKCGYCDFASVAGQDELADRYLDALDREMASILTAPKDLETIFVGGGTPTYLNEAQLDRFLDRLVRWFPPGPATEFTVESNPNTLTREKVRSLVDHGVNRVSLGAQSFHPHLLERLERNHDPASVYRAVDLLKPVIANVSIDLIFGIPGQTMTDWQTDLREGLALPIEHVSSYGLTYEKGTLLWKQRRLGIIEPTEEETEAAMYEYLLEETLRAGFEQYEVSNFARQGELDRRSRHNSVYWANAPYYGFGTGAAAFVDGHRTLNLRPLLTYIETVEEGRSPIHQSESLPPEARARETAVLELRRTQGIDLSAFQRKTGFHFRDLAPRELEGFVELGLLIDDGNVVRLSPRGFLLADGIFSRIV
ncbi:radical SAM family heme chaperone HemW [bacterium]|nr:radical SAM family heme chaperone HemW [bacterium]